MPRTGHEHVHLTGWVYGRASGKDIGAVMAVSNGNSLSVGTGTFTPRQLFFDSSFGSRVPDNLWDPNFGSSQRNNSCVYDTLILSGCKWLAANSWQNTRLIMMMCCSNHDTYGCLLCNAPFGKVVTDTANGRQQHNTCPPSACPWQWRLALADPV